MPISGSPFSTLTSATKNLSGLTASTTYYYRVKANNGSCDSAFLTGGTFSTLCTNFTLPVSEGFNTSGTAVFPTCWSQQTVVGTSNITFQASSSNPTTVPQEGTRYVYWNSFSIASGNETRLVSPPITSTGASSVDVEFQWMHDAGSSTLTTEGVQVQYSLDGITWIDSGAFVQRYNATLTGWNKKTITLPVGAGNQATIYVGFKFHSTFGNNCSMDAVAIKATPNCLPPTLTATTAITTTSATINWTASASVPANGYIYEIRTSGLAGSGATGLVTTSTVGAGILTANISGLSAATSYSVYVQSDCGGSLSTFTAAGTFVTACTIPNNPSALSFTGISATGLTLNFTAASPVPTAYVIFRSTNATAPTPVNGTTYASGTAYTFGAGSYNCVANGTAVTLAQTGLISNTQYYYYIFSRDNTNLCFGAPWYSTGVNASQITCPATPTSFVNSAITNSSATVSWTASIVGGGANTFNYVLEVTTDAAYTLPISGSPFATLTATTQNLSGLTSATQYFYRVKANNTTCDSAFLSGGAFTTACDAIIAYPSLTDFAIYLPSICWNEGDLGDLSTGPATTGAASISDWVADDYLNATGTGTGAAKMNIDTALGSEWIISPSFAIPASGLYRVKYNVGATQFAATTALTTAWEADDFVELLVSTTGTSNWTVLKTYNSSNVPSNLGQIDDVDLTAYNGQTIRLAFRAFEGATNGLADIDFFIDNLTLELKPNPIVISPSPSAIICSGTSTTLVASSASAYAYTWSPATGLNTTTGSTVVASPTATTVYTVSGVLGTENTTQSITVVVNPTPANVTISPSVSVCQNDIATLTASSQSSGSFNIGVSSGSSTTANTPYRQSVTTNARMQYLITKAELNAAGINAATNITSLTFNTTSAGSGLMSNYEIKLGNTSTTVLTGTFLTPTFTTVFSNSYTAVLGANLHTFSTPFAWDGTSNIVINICHTASGGTASTVNVSTTSFTSTSTNSGSTACTVNTGGATSSSRPTMILGSFSSAPITWSPTTDLFTDAGATLSYTGTATNTVYSKSISTLIYTATATLVTCSKNANVTVTRKPNASIATQPISQTVCQGTSVTLSVVGANSATFLYQWFKNGVSISGATNATLTFASSLPTDTANYTVEVLGDCGPVVTSAVATLTVKTNVGITSVTSSANPICAGATATLTANGVVGTNAILTWWTGSGGSGSNLGNTPTITFGPGTYYARVTGDCGTPQEVNFTINTIAVPTYANLQFPGSSTICQTGSLTAYGQVYQVGVTEAAGAGTGITAEFGYNSSNTDPSTWTSWNATTFNAQVGNNDEYQHTFNPPTSGTYYYTFRYRQGSCDWLYGGYSASGGGFWNGTSNVNGQLIVNPNVTPTFTAYSPICSGDTLSALPTTSNNGITGTWSPSLNNTATTTYTFTPTSGQCATSATLTITVNPNVIPTFTAYSAICSGDTLPGLPSTSNNGITGTWSPILNNTATTTYTFTPNSGQCAASTTLIITVNPNVTPTFTAYAPICSGDTLSALPTTSNNGITGTWSPSLNNTVTTTYTFTPTSGQCATVTTLTITVNTNATILTHPVSQTVCEGMSVTLSVIGGNSSTFTYQWYKNGVLIGSATNASLTIASALPSDSGNYTVEVSGNCGPVVTSNVAVLTVKTNVSITSITSSANPICSNATAILTANGVAGTNVILTWWTGSNGTGTNLGSTPTIIVGSGTYYARITGDCGAPQEISFTINTIAQPTYVNLQFPGTASICNGNSLTVYGQVYQVGVTPGAGLQGTGITAEFGYNTTDSDPSTWTSWSSTTFNPGGGGVNNDEYQYTFTPSTSGTYFYTYRYRQGTCEWLYGGYSISGGGFWNGTSNVNGQLIVNPSPTASISGNNGPIVCTSSDAIFNLTGTSGSIVTYNINGGASATVTLTGGTATVSISNVTMTQTLNLISVNYGSCSATLIDSSTITLGSSTTWVASNGGEWTNGSPSSSSTVIFNANYVIASDFNACTITVSNNAIVSVDSNIDVNLYGALTVSSGSFTLNNNANLMQSSSAANSGNIILKRNSSALKRQDYTLWSSPLTAVVGVQTLNNFSPLTLLNRFYEYNPSNNLYVSVVPTTTWFSSAKSYLIRMPNNHPTFAQVWNGTFNGVPNNGSQTYAMATGFNAVGNPYPSRLNVHNFIDANTNIDGTLYFWRKTNNDTQPSYASLTKMAYVANGALGGDTGSGYFVSGNESNWVVNIGQGFIVNSSSATNLSFNNSMRRNLNSAQFFRTSEANATLSETNLFWLNLNVGAAYSQMAVGYTADATLAFDRGIDGKNINPEFYLTSLIGLDEYTIQGRPEFTNTDVVPLSFKVMEAGTYSISLNNTTGLFTAGTQPIYVKDNVTNTYHDLNSGSYSFTSDAGTYTNRFEIVYQTALGVENPNLNNVIVYNQNNEVNINSGNVVMDSVKIFDIRGRLLVSKSNINASESSLKVGKTNQVLIVQITSIDGVKITKKVIN